MAQSPGFYKLTIIYIEKQTKFGSQIATSWKPRAPTSSLLACTATSEKLFIIIQVESEQKKEWTGKGQCDFLEFNMWHYLKFVSWKSTIFPVFLRQLWLCDVIGENKRFAKTSECML